MRFVIIILEGGFIKIIFIKCMQRIAESLYKLMTHHPIDCVAHNIQNPSITIDVESVIEWEVVLVNAIKTP